MSLPTRTGRSLSRASLMVAAALLGVSVSPQAKAATFNWNQTTASTYSWTTSANWNESPYPNAIGDVATLSSGTVAQTVNLNAVITIGELNFGATGPTLGAPGYTLAAGTGGLLILDDTDGAVSINKLSGSPSTDTISADILFNDTLTISNNSGGGVVKFTGTMRSLTSDVTLTGSGAVSAGSIVTGAISTAGGLIKDIGIGITQMDVNTTYAGTTWIKGGRLIANSGASIPIRSAITIDAGAVLESKQATMTWGSIAGAGNVTNTGSARVVTIGRDDTSTSFSGTLTANTPANLAITKIGAGTLTLQPAGSNQNTYTGITTVSGGNLVLDTSSSSRTSAFWAATPLTISGGNFELKGRSAQTLTQTLGAFVLGATGGSITLTPNSGTSTNLEVTTLTATATGGALLITSPTGTTFKTSSLIASTALNGRLVFNDGTANTYNWAYNNNTATTAVSGFLSSTALPSTGGGAVGTSYILTAGQNQTTANATIGTLKLSSTSGTTQVLDLATFNMQLGGGTTSTPGAILIDGTANWNINGSTGLLTNNTPGTSPDLIFNHYGTGTVTVNAGIGGATALALVKAGPGTLVLAGTNAFTGAIFVNGGVLSFSNVAAAGAGSLGNGSATAVTIRDGATLRYTGSGAADTIAATGAGGHTFTLQGGLATIDVPITAATLILSGAITGSATATGGLIKAGAGTLRPSAASTYTGPTFVTAGTLQAGIATAAFGSSSSPLDISSGATVDINSLDQTIGSLSGAGTVTNSTATAKTLTVGGANLSTTFTGSFTNGTATVGQAFIKTGTGILILAGSTTSTWTGNHQANGGVLRLATSNQFAANVPIYVANAAGPALFELSSSVTQTVGSLNFGGTAITASSQGNVLLGSSAVLTLGGNVTYTNNGNTVNQLAAYVTGAGSIALSASRTFTINDSTAVPSSAAELTVAVPITGAFGIVKTGFGNLLLSGANTFSGATTTLTAGGLILDYTTQNNAKIPSANSLTLNGGGSLILRGNASAGTSQDVLSTNLASGGFNAITLTPGGSQKIVFNMGAFTRAASAGTVRFTLPTGTQDATNGITTTTTNVNGVLGIGAAWATATDSAGVTNFAVNNGTNNIVLLTSTTNNDVTTWAAGSDVTDSTGYTGTTAVATNVNTLRFNSGSASTVTLGANLPLSVLTGGILQTANAANATISGGTLTSGTSSELIFTTDVAALPLTVSSTIAGNETITKTGLGTLKLTGVNAYTGGTLIQGGTLQVTGGNAIGDASVVTLTNVRTSVFELLGNETVAGIAGGNTGAGGLGEVRIGTNTLRLNQSANLTYSGLLTGSGTIIKSGSGTMTIDATSGAGFTGTFEVSQGQVTLSGNVTQLAAVTSIVLSGPTAVLYLPNDQNTAVGSRINDTATVTLRNTAGNMGLSVRRTTGTSTGTETVGQLVLDAGHNTITADATTGTTPIGGWSFTNATSLVRNNLATALLVGKKLGFGSTARGRISFSVNPGGSVGGAGAAASTTISIFPYFVGESTSGTPTTSNVGNSFVTYVSAAEGMRPLDVTTEYLVDSAAPASGTNNVRYTSTTAITTPAAINSLVLDSATGVALTGSASSMEITSGAILAAGAGSSSISTLTGLTSGATPVPYYVYVTHSSGVLTLNTPLTSAAALVKSGAGTLVLSSSSNAFTDVYFNQGALQVANINMLGAGSLKFFGGTLQLGAASGGFTGDPSTKTITFGTGGGTLDTNGNSVTFTNGIGNSGAGGLTKIGNGTLTLNGAASYTGATTVSAGTLAMGVNSAIGTGALTVSSAATLAMGANNATVSGLTLSAGSANIISGTGTLTVNGDATLNQGTVSAALAGSMNLLKSTASQTVTLSNAANTFTGYTWIQDGTLSVTALANAGSNSSLGAATGANASILIGNGASTNATLAYSSASNSSTNRQVLLAGSTGGATIDSGSLAGLLTMSGEAYGIFAGAKALTLQGGNGDTSTPNVYSGLISNGVGVISVTKSGAGTWRLSGSNTYSGLTTVTNGTLILGNATAMGSGAATITGGTLNLNSLTIANAVTVSGGTLSGGTIALSQVTTESGTISAILTGASNLTKLAAGTLILSAANDYTGTTTVFNGDLQVGASGTTGDLGAGAVTLSGGTLTINRSNAYALSNSLSGRGSFRQIGSGTTTLSGTNSSYTGTTTISAGTLTLGNATAMGSGAATITGGTLNLNSQTIANAVTVSGGTLSGGTIALSQVTTSSGTISAILTGASNLTKSASGTLTLSGANDFTGTTTVSNGTLTLGNATALGSGAATISGGTLNLNSQTITNAVTVSGGTLSGGTIALSQVTTSLGTISAILTGDSNLTKSAAGTLTLSGANDYTGTTTVSNGTLTLGNATALGSGAATISGGTLNLNSQTITNAVTVSGGTLSGGTIALSQVTTESGTISAILTGAFNLTKSAAGNLTLSGANDYTGTTTVSNGTLQIGAGGTTGSLGADAVTLSGGALTINRSNAYALSNSLSGSGAFSQIGSGTTTLSGTNTSFTGTTTVSAGTLTLGNATALGSGAATISGGTLNLNSQTITNAVTVSGGTLSGGTIALSQVTTSSGTISAILTGASNLTKSASGTLTLSGANDYTGTTTVSNGTLTLGNATALGSGAATISGGTLNLNSQTITNAVTVSGGTLSGGTIALSQVTTESGTISAILTGATGLTKSAAGTLTLSGANDYSGTTTVSNGTLQIGAGSTTGSLGSGAVTLSGGTLTINRSNAYALSNSLSGSGAFSQIGSGTTTLSGTNTSFTGTTTVSNGTLTLGNATALGSGAATISGGTLNLNSQTIANTITVSGGTLSGGTIALSQVTASSGTISAILTGATALTKSSTGTLTLSGANTYSLGTTISGGTLQVGAGGTTGSLGSGAVTLSGGALTINRSNDFALSNGITGTGSFTQSGFGTTTLSGTNTFTGAVTVANGTLVVASNAALGDLANSVTVAGNANVVGTAGGTLVLAPGAQSSLTSARTFNISGRSYSQRSGSIVGIGESITLSGTVSTLISANDAALVQIGGLMTLSGTVVTGTSTSNLLYTGSSNMRGAGSYAITGTITGAGVVYRANGQGTMIFNPTDASGFSGVIRSNAGTYRFLDPAKLGTNVATGTGAALYISATSTMEFRSGTTMGETVSWGKALYLGNNTTGTLVADHALGSSAINQINAFSSVYSAGTSAQNLTLTGRNGAGFTFTGFTTSQQAANGTDVTVTSTLGAGTSTIAGDVLGWDNTNTVARTFTAGVAGGDLILTGSILAAEATNAVKHALVKTGLGTLTIQGVTSTITGDVTLSSGGDASATTGTSGTTYITDFRSLGTTSSGVIKLGNATTTTGSLTIGVAGTTPTVAGLTTSRVISINTTTKPVTINASQPGANPVVISSNFTGVSSATARTLFLGGSNTADNLLSGVLPDITGVISLTKKDAGTWALSGANTYTGATTITGGTLKLKATAGASNIIASAAAVTFDNNTLNYAAGGTLELVALLNTATTESLGALTPTAGMGTVKLTGNGFGGTANLIFSSLAAVNKAAAINFDTSSTPAGSVTFTTAAASSATALFGDGHVYVNGTNFAYSSGTSNVVIAAPTYGVTSGFVNAAAGAASLTSLSHNFVTGAISAQTDLTISSLKLTTNNLTLASGQTLTIQLGANGEAPILQSGGTATIAGGAGITSGGSGALVFRVNGATDILNLDTPMLVSSTGGFTKSGLGTLVLNAVNAETTGGAINILEGTVKMAAGSRIGATGGLNLIVRTGATLDLNGTTQPVGQLDGTGSVTNSSATDATLTMTGGNVWSGSFTEGSTGKLNVTRVNSGNTIWNGLSTNTGVMTFNITTTKFTTVTTLADIGVASSIGKGDATSTASNAASLVFTGDNASGLAYAGLASVSTNRLFTLNSAIATPGAAIANNSSYNAALVFSNTGAIVFGAAANAYATAQTLTLTGSPNSGTSADNYFGPKLTNNAANTSGTTAAQYTALTKSGTSIWVLGNTANDYSGTTTISGGVLNTYVSAGSTLSASSPLFINGGQLQTQGEFTRSLAASAVAGSPTVTLGVTASGFSAGYEKLTVAIGGTSSPTALTWGSGGFFAAGSTVGILLNSATSLAEVEFRNAIDLNQGSTNNVTRTITVTDNGATGTDFATISGVISNSTGAPTNGVALSISGGILRLFGANTYDGSTKVIGGTLTVNSLGLSTTPGVGTSVGTSTNANTSAGALRLGNAGTGGAIVQYVGPGETSDRLIQLDSTTGNIEIHADGSGPLVLSNVLNNIAAGAKVLYLRGINTGTNMVTSLLADNGGALGLNIDGGATWILSGANTLTGTVNINANAGVGNDAAFGTTGTLKMGGNGTIFAYGNDRTVATPIASGVGGTAGGMAFAGDYSLNFTGAWTFENTNASSTLTNNVVSGKTVSFTGSSGSWNLITNNRTLTFNGSGDTVWSVPTSTSTAFGSNITYSGTGSLTIGAVQDAFKATATVPALTVSSGAVRIGANNVLPTGATYGNTVMSPAVSVTATLDLNGYAQDFNGFTATSAGTSILDVKSTSARTVTFGYNDAAVSLGNPAAGTPATGTFTFKNSLDGLLSLTKTGTGTMTLNYGASLEHAGVTTVSAGTLSLQGPLIFKNTPDFTVAGGATLNLFNSSGQTWNVSGLNLGAGSGTANLGMELGSASNSDKFIVRGAATLANTVNFQLRPIGGFAAGSYDLVTADSGLNAGTKTVTLSSITSEAGQGSSYALSSTATAVTLTVSDLTGNVYWKGGVSNNWFGYNASGSNFTSDSAGLNVIAGLPGTSNKVIFNAAGQTTASQTVSLDGPVFSGGLVFNNATGSGPLTSITLNAAANAATTINGTLTLAPSASTDGIDIQTGAPAAVTISTAISLGANQTWNVFDSGTTLTASGFVTGSYGLTKDGAGTLVLGSGSLYPTYTGPTVIKGGTLKAGATTMTSWFSSLEIQSGATFTTNGGADLNIAALSGAGTVNNTHGSTGVVLYAGYNNADTTFSGTIVNGAAGTQGLRKVGSGVLTLNAASAASTATGTLAAYAGSILFDYSASSLTSMWTGTGSVILYGGGLVWKANPSVAMNASLGALTSSAGANSLTIDPNGSTLLQVVTLSGSVTDSASGMSLLVTSPANTEIRLGSNYTATSGSAPRGKIVFTTGDGNFDFIKNAGATTASAAFTDYTLDPTPSAGATDTNTPKLTTSLALGGSWTTDKMKIQTSAAGQTLNIGAGNTLTLTAGGLIFQGADAYTITGGSIQGYTSVNSDLVAHVYGNGVLTLGSNVTNGIGASVFTKAGPGTLNLTGQILSTGASYINQGVLNINAAQSITGSLTVLGGTLNVNAAVVGNPASTKLDMAASGSGGRTVVNVAADMTLFATTQGGERGSANAYNQTAGTVTVTPGNTGTQYVAAAYGYGYFNLTGGTYNISGSGNRFMATGGSSGLGVSVIKVGGTGFLDHTNAEWFLNYGNTSITVSDTGLIDHTGSTNAFALIMDSAARDMIGSLNVAGGTVKTGNQPIQVGNSATAGKSPGAQAFINLAKGTLSTGANLATVLPTANDAFIYFAGAGGTLKASNNLTNFLPATIQGATLNAVLYGAIDNQVGSPDFDGGLTVDTSGFDVAFSASLRAAAGVGITQADMTLTAGSGYVGAPLVRFSTTGMIPGGTPAQGYAIIDAALGTVTGIVITNPGTYVAGTVPKLDLIGGGGSGASVAFSGLSTANAAAGLTKVGNGKLTLNAANTYAGGTNVNAGTLALGGNEVLADTGAVTVGGGTLDLTSFVETAGIVTLDSGTITGTTGSLSSSSDFRLRSGTVSGILTGAGGIAKSTSGTVALSAGNTFSGTVSVAAGKLQFSADANLGNGSATNVVSVNGGTLAYTAASALTLSANRTIEFGPSHATIEVADAAGVLTLPGVRASSTGNLTKTGVGKLVLAGTTAWNSGANGVTVNAGTLQAGFGTGGVAAINVGAAGTLNFINSTAEVLTLGGTAGALTLAGGANLGFELGASGSNDKIVVGAGGTAVTAGNVTINLLTIAGFGAGTFDLLSAPSGLKPLGVVYSLGSAPSGYNYTINQTDTLVSLVVAAFVPRYWTNAQTGGSWATLTGGTASNWSTDTAGLNDYGATPGSADTVIFSATSLAGGALTTTLDGSYTIDGLQFINATSTATTTFLLSQGTGSGTLTIAPSSTSSGIVVAANAGAVTISAPINASTTGGAASQTWSIDGTGASSLTVTGNITIGAGINKTGAGTLTLSGTNTGSGGVTIGAGALHVGSANALGTGALTVGALTTFDNSSGSALTLANNATNWNGAFTFTGTNDLSFGTGGATLGQSLTATVAGRVLTVASVTDGAGSYDLTKAGAGTLTITGALTIGGAMSLNAGTLNIGTGGNMGAVTAASGTTLAMSGANTLASLIGTSATLTLSGANTISGVVTLNGGTLTASGNNPSIGGAVTINSGTATFSGNNGFASASLVTGSLTLSGTNTFVTGLSMAAGTLNLNSAGALGGGSLAISGGTLNNSSGSAKVLTGAGAGSVTGSFTFTGSSSLSVGTSSLAISGNPTFTISGSTLTFGGDVTGASTLTKTGTGGLSVTGGLTHDGGVTVLNGTLTVGASSSYTGATSIQASAAGAGTLVLSGTSTLTNAGNSLTMGSLSGTGGTRLDLSNGSASFNSLTVQTNHATANTIVIGTGQELNIGGGVTIGVNGAGATTTRLTISGAGTFSIGTPEDPTGAGFQLGAHTTSAFSNDATLTMSGLTAFYANLGAGTFKVGDPTNSGGAATAGSKLYLAKTSTIIASTITSDTQNGSVTNYVYLGDTANVFNATNLYVSGAAVDAGARTNGQISWDSGVTTGTFRLRGLGGGDATAITNINVAYGLGTSAYATTGLVDLAGHSSDILATTISIGGNSGGSGTPGHKTGTFTFDTGSLVATTVNLGARTGGFQIANTITGTLNLMASGGSGTATFTNLTMGLNSSSSTTSNGASVATLNIGGGTVGITGTLTMGNNSIVGTTAQTVAPVQATTNISGGTVTIGTLNMNLNSAANSGTNRASVAGLYITGGTTEITALSLANTSTGTAIATSTLSITAGTLTLGADLAYTRTLGTVNSTLTLNGGTLDMSDKAIGVAGALIGTLNLQSGTLKNVNQINDGAGFVKAAGAGSNTLIIDGTNSFSGTFTISSGTVQVGAGSTTGTLGTVSVTNNAALTFNRSDAATFSNVITGSGTLTKVGNGTLTLTGNNSFTGGTTITNGTITIGHASSLGTASVNVGALGTLNLGGFTIGNTIVLAEGATLTGGQVSASTAPTTGTLAVELTGSLPLEKTGSGRLELTGANTFSGATSVSNGTIAVSGFGNGSTASPLGITDLTDPSKLVIGGGATLEFTGSDPVTTTARSFTIADSGTIAATGTGALNFNGSSKIKLTGATPALTLSATSTTSVNRFDSALDGTDAISTLTIDGTGIWVIGGNANRFKGTATFSIAAGTTQGATLGFDSGSLGYSASSAINVGDNAVLRWSAGNDDDISGRLRIGTGDTAKLDIGGNDVVFASAPKNAAGAAITAGTIEKKGAGTLTIGGAVDSDKLAFNVPTGKLSVDGTVGNVNLTSSGTILGGGGTVGSVTTVAGSILSAGNSPGTLTIDGNLLLAASTILQWEVQDALDPAKYDQIHVTGNLDLTQVTNNNQRIIINVASLVGTGTGAGVDLGAPLNFNNPDTVGTMPRTFDFMRVDGAISFASGGLWNITNVFSFDLDDFQYTNGGSKNLSLWSISSEVRGNDTYIMITAVPEPSTYGFGLGALALAAAAIRRRRKNQAAKAEASGS